MFQKTSNFIKGISVNRYSKAGTITAIIAFCTYFLFELLQITGVLKNAFIALIAYLTFPTLFFIGIVLIIYGWIILKKLDGKISDTVLRKHISELEITPGVFGSKFSRTLFLAGIISILFFVSATLRMLTYMDRTYFCGNACHTIMNPEWEVYQNSPHARVKCVDCHVGYGLQPLIASKINGMRQMVLATFNAYSQPIPTPVHQLRPARETCEKCHWPSKFYGTKIRKIVHFKHDSASTPVYTTLAMKIDEHSGSGIGKSGIHWHIARDNEIRYTSVDDKREEMIWVDVLQKNGSYKRFRNQRLARHSPPGTDSRILDCVDCHNRATHIYQDPEQAVDEAIQAGEIPSDLPYIKREAVAAILPVYPEKNMALNGITSHMQNFYRKELGSNITSRLEDLEKIVHVLQGIYRINIHSQMKIEWNSYPSLIGHRGYLGCFRCHNPNMTDGNGTHIRNDCTLCHSILANEEDDPFKYLKPLKSTDKGLKDKNYKMHQYLQEEFLKNVK